MRVILEKLTQWLKKTSVNILGQEPLKINLTPTLKSKTMVKDKEMLKPVKFSVYLPDIICGMKELDRSLFNIKVNVPAIKCNEKSCGKFQKTFKNVLLNRPHFRSIIPSNFLNSNERFILLNPEVNKLELLNDDQQKVFLNENGEFCQHELLLEYKDFSAEEIFSKIFSNFDIENVSSFETVGHIAHLNLREKLLDYKKVIGQVILDKNPNIETVVNKVDSIEETFRYFQMELLAGLDKMNTTVIEHGCTFQFDYSKVYWNSRLQTEHKRLVDQVKEGDIVFDVFAGVGPFSIPIAKKKCFVHCNDLNKNSYLALKHNITLNKLHSSFIKAYNMDGRDFLRDVVVKEILKSSCHLPKMFSIHIIMNLPAIAPQFLDVFKENNFTNEMLPESINNIFVHCYLFSKSESPENEAKQLVSEAVGYDISPKAKVRVVRRVAPNKVMLCVTFDLKWFHIQSVKPSTKRLNEGESLDDHEAKIMKID
ncbi:uncharacterized protein LOC100199427 isoform X3 [Hydra vulgaris]|uniref:tRNA (guanine(37)-N1)-methyltransferase n=1 Tax=Hydra vulgaris TaxID=6087 RepID=A0ABM4BCY9_HYDVU